MLTYECFICKNGIEKLNDIDPCGVTIFSNCDKDYGEQKEQTFYCHYECFKNINNDNYLVLDEISTENEIQNENQIIKNQLMKLTDEIFNNFINSNLSEYIYEYTQGTWLKVKDIVRDFPVLLELVQRTEEYLFEPVIITWFKDREPSSRGFKHSRCIMIASDSYEHVNTFIIEGPEK